MSALIFKILRRGSCQQRVKMNIGYDIVPDIVVFLRYRSSHQLSTKGLSLRYRSYIVVFYYDIGADIVVQTYDIATMSYAEVVVIF
jgi:hypothetical protein